MTKSNVDKKTALNHKIIYYSEFRNMKDSNAWVDKTIKTHDNWELTATMVKKQERFLPTENPDIPPVSEFIIVSQLEFSSTTE